MMFPKRLLVLAAVVGTLAYIGLTHTAALITYITDSVQNESEDEEKEEDPF
jgi:hypothetical protein